MMQVEIKKVGSEDDDMRLDRWFKKHYPTLPFGRLQKLLRTGQVRVNGKRVKGDVHVVEGQEVRVPPLKEDSGLRVKKRMHMNEDDVAWMQSLILYKNDDVIALNKPAGIAVQGGPKIKRHLDGMLDALQFDCEERPRLVHRLDKDTSGVLLLARNRKMAKELMHAFQQKRVKKVYWALVAGVPTPLQGKINLPLLKESTPEGDMVLVNKEHGQRAVTFYQTVSQAGMKMSWLSLSPVTGRQHQLRVHCAAKNIPIVGDERYGGEKSVIASDDIANQMHLHARMIVVPRRGGKSLKITAPLSDHMKATWKFFDFHEDEADDEMFLEQLEI